MELPLLKKHLRVDHSFEDDLIQEYERWAEDEIKDSVSTEANRNEAFFTESSHFNRAVVLLTTHYFENRIGYADKDLKNTPDGIQSAVQKLRGSYVPSEEVIADA